MEIIRSSSLLIRLSFLIPILWIVLSYFYITTYISNLKTTLYKESVQLMQTQAHSFIDEKAEVISIIATTVSLNPTIKNIILENKIDTSIKEYAKSLAKNSTLEHIWLQVVDRSGVSRYRSWTDKKGDTLKGVRLDVDKMLLHPKVYSSISVGKFDLTFKSMVPMFENGVFFGFVEVLAKFNSISKKLRNRGYEAVVVVEEKYQEQILYPFTKRFIDQHYIANIDADEEVLQLLQKIGVEKAEYIKDYMIYDNQLIASLSLKDVNGADMAAIIMMKELSSLDQLDIIKSRNRLVLIASLVFIVMVIFIYYLYVIKYKNFISKLNKELEDEVVKKTEELQHLAHHDVLTQLPNRVYFNQYLEDSLKHAKRKGSTLSVLFLDLDKFKDVNDTFGHHIGDKLLQYIAKELSDITREVDFISRLGGDEFIIVVEDVDAQSLAIMCNKLIDALHKKIIIDNYEIPISFSIGVSSYPEDAQNAHDLLRDADTAMYKAKNLGKDRFEFYNEEMTKEVQGRFNLIKKLDKALENSEFLSYFHPKIDSRSGKVIGLEALIRWRDPEDGMKTPNHFIPLAEESNLIIQIDEWMIENSMNIVSQWHKSGLFTGTLSLNISVKHLEQKNFVTFISQLLERVGFESTLLELEITESQLMKERVRIVDVLNTLRKMGIKISIDDFGTGYSSLSYLKDLPIDILKIDKSFTDTIGSDRVGEAIVKSIITLADNLGVMKIAEGVESKKQLEFLSDNNCYIIQGHYYSKPLSQKECELYLRRD